MARPRSANPKHNNLSLRLTDREVAALDANRKGLSRSGYLRMLLRDATKTSSVTELGRPTPEPPAEGAEHPPAVHQNMVRSDSPRPHDSPPSHECQWVLAGGPSSLFKKCTICDERRPR